jgi:hypothetical protein
MPQRWSSDVLGIDAACVKSFDFLLFVSSTPAQYALPFVLKEVRLKWANN